MSITPSSQPKRIKKNILKFFDYIDTTVFPNIRLYNYNDNNTIIESPSIIPFTQECIHEYIWGYKYMKKYYSLLKLKNSNYVYIKGHIDFDSDEFKIYMGNSLSTIISYMSESIYRKYEKDTTFQIPY
jgi:hypothetical protein